MLFIADISLVIKEIVLDIAMNQTRITHHRKTCSSVAPTHIVVVRVQ